MARRGWLGLPLGQAFAPRSRQGEVGLVLSGGGSKASFQIGALRHLYEVVGIAPTTMVGTSAGSILASLLAQSSDPAEQAQAVLELEVLWRGMERQSDMFSERAWFRTLRARGPEVLALLERDQPRTARRLPRINLPFTQGFQLDPDDEPQPEPEPGHDDEQLSPELATLALATADPRLSRPEFSPSQVVQLLAGLSRMRGISADIGSILLGAQATRSMYVPGPLLRSLLGTGLFQGQRVAASGVRTRIAMVALETGALHFMCEDGSLVDRDNAPVGSERHEFSRGVLASCSIPTVFAPVQIGDQFYVDGGVRENLPAEMAIGQLGCTTTYVVTSNSPNVPVRDSFAEADIVSIMLRATEIQSDETERDEVAYARSAGAVVIEPEIDVHDALTIDPGLVSINIDYGWMRSAEVHLGCSTAEQALVRSIITARRRIWELEKAYLDPTVPHSEHDLLLLARLKFDLRLKVPQVRPEVLPQGADRWWQEWEGHSSAPVVPPPWMVE